MINIRFYALSIRMLCIVILMLNGIVAPHGFSRYTMIVLPDDEGWMSIEHMANYKKQKKHDVASYDTRTKQFVNNSVKATNVSESNCFFVISFKQRNTSEIACTYAQQFYRVLDNAWIAACEIEQGDALLCKDNTCCEVASVMLINEPLEVYTIEVKNTHTFLVGTQGLVTHNTVIPMITMAGLSIPLSTGCGGTIGAPLGPVGICAGIVIGGAIGYIIKACAGKKSVDYKVPEAIDEARKNFLTNDAKTDSDAQAPGKPTEKDGFIPKKKWDGKKVKHPKTGQVGWPDKKGHVWVPTGHGSGAHGGPHWDVVAPNGIDYVNVYPGGIIRKGR